MSILLNVKKVDVTPDRPCFQSGYIQRTHEWSDVHDPVMATVYSLTINYKNYAWVGTDFIGPSIYVSHEIEKRVKEQMDLEDMILGGTHNHSAPSIELDPKRAFGGVADPEFVEKVISTISTAIVKGFESQEEVDVKYSSLYIDGCYSNRNNPNFLSDKKVHLLGFFKEDQLISIMVNMAMHNTVLGPNNYSLTAETYGNLRSRLEEKFNCPVLMSQGNAGDMGNRQYRTGQEFEDMEKLGFNLYDQIVRKMRDWKDLDVNTCTKKHIEYVCKFHIDVKSYEEQIKDFEEQLKHTDDLTERKVLLSGIAGFKMKIDRGDGDHEVVMPVEIYTLDDLQIVCVPGELGSLLGMMIKKASPKKACILWGYTGDGNLGYIVDRRAYQEMCQEKNTTIYPEGEPEKFTEYIIQNL